jgi:hypothetical protein
LGLRGLGGGRSPASAAPDSPVAGLFNLADRSLSLEINFATIAPHSPPHTQPIPTLQAQAGVFALHPDARMVLILFLVQPYFDDFISKRITALLL